MKGAGRLKTDGEVGFLIFKMEFALLVAVTTILNGQFKVRIFETNVDEQPDRKTTGKPG